MRTLDRWASRFAEIPNTIECPVMHVIGRDHEAPVFIGPGHIDIKSSTKIEFTMFATAENDAVAFQRVLRATENQYDILNQFRLISTDFEGVEWNCGWTLPLPERKSETGWLIRGSLNSLSTRDTGYQVDPQSGVELLFHPNLFLPMGETMLSISSIGNEEVSRRWSGGRHKVTILNSEIVFSYKPFSEALWVTAKTSNELPHLYAENWIAEPLRILLGKPVYPRLVARNFGDGTAAVSLRQSPEYTTNQKIASLMGDEITSTLFWELFEKLLTLIGESKGQDGMPNFEAHPITRFYEEIFQATRGSRWVLCMTLASAAEGLAKMSMKPEDHRSSFALKDIESLKTVVKAWVGDEALKDRTLNDIARSASVTVSRYLRQLVRSKALEESHAVAWMKVRNAVMHGNLISPWPTAEEDANIKSLADLVRRLTRILIDRHTSNSPYKSEK